MFLAESARRVGVSVVAGELSRMRPELPRADLSWMICFANVPRGARGAGVATAGAAAGAAVAGRIDGRIADVVVAAVRGRV